MTEQRGKKKVLKGSRKAKGERRTKQQPELAVAAGTTAAAESPAPETPREPIAAPVKPAGGSFFDLMKEPLDAPTTKQRLPLEELNRIDQSRRERGEELARKIFDIANKQRLCDLDLYVNTINEAVLDKESEENQAILETACEYFRKTYGAWCRERGKSINMLDNIVHRTGRETEELMAKIIRGFDVKSISRELWQLNLEKRIDELHVARKKLYELTNSQVRELREEYNTIPAQDLAAELHDALIQTNLTNEASPDIDALRYVLRGRSGHEIKQIEFQFDERYHFVREGQAEPPLREQVAKLPKGAAAEIGRLMQGFSSRDVADKAHKLLVHCSEASEVVEKDIELHPDFAGNFRRDYRHHPSWERELRARERVDQELSYLTPLQFKNVTRQLEKRFSETLTAALYSCNKDFDGRRVALQLFKAFQNVAPRRLCRKDQDYLSTQQLLEIKARFRTSTHSEITNIIQKWADEQKALESTQILRKALLPLENLDPNQLYFVKEAFCITTGIKLSDFVDAKVKELCRDEVPKYVSRLVANRLSGISRLPLRADLFDIFSTSEQRRQNYLNIKPRAEQLEQARRDTAEISKILQDRRESRKAQAILDFLKKLERPRCAALEKMFLESSGKALVEEIKEKVKTTRARQGALLLLSGFNPWIHAEKLYKRIDHLFELLDAAPQAIGFVLREHKALYKEDLFKRARHHYRSASHERERTLCLSVLFTPNAMKLNKILKAKEAIDEQSLSYLTRQLTRSRLEVLAVESCYNRCFAHFEYCYDKIHGTLLQRLRVLATAGFLPRRFFASSILLLEDVDPGIPMTMQDHLSVPDIGGETVLKFHALLRQFRDHLTILQKAYNALNEHATLRETIYELRVPLEVKNKTLLLLDGYDPDVVAKELREVVGSKLRGEELGKAVLELLADPRQKAKNPRIPKQANWIDEMFHQIRLSYEASGGTRLIADLFRKEVPCKGAGIHAVAYRLYGEVSKVVIDVRRLLERRKTEADELGVLDRKIVQSLADLLPPLRERALNMYDAYYAQPTGRPDLLSEIKAIKNQQVRSKALRLLHEALTWDVPGAGDEEKDKAASAGQS